MLVASANSAIAGNLHCDLAAGYDADSWDFALQGDDEPTRQNARYAALFTTLITFILSLIVWSKFDPTSSAFQLLEEKSWFGAGLIYKLGIDGMSFTFGSSKFFGSHAIDLRRSASCTLMLRG